VIWCSTPFCTRPAVHRVGPAGRLGAARLTAEALKAGIELPVGLAELVGQVAPV
jgi:hypothetical protein